MVDMETDPFAQTLVEALRSGPGSAAWRDAVTQLDTVRDGADEYQALLAARERLESGKPWRAIRAGAGFTRKLMENLDKPGKSGGLRGIPAAPIVAVIAAIGVIGVLGWLGSHLVPKADPSHGELSELANTYFSTELARGTFDGSIPAQWREIGALPLDVADGMQPGAQGRQPGGGIVLATPLSSDEPFAFVAELRLDRPSDNVVAQVFVSSSGDFSDDRATSSQELLWSLHGKTQQVVLDGRVLPTSSMTVPDGSVHVRIVMNHDQAVVEIDGQRLWGGPHELAGAARWVGVRFIRSAPVRRPGIQLRSVNLLKR